MLPLYFIMQCEEQEEYRAHLKLDFNKFTDSNFFKRTGIIVSIFYDYKIEVFLQWISLFKQSSGVHTTSAAAAYFYNRSYPWCACVF